MQQTLLNGRVAASRSTGALGPPKLWLIRAALTGIMAMMLVLHLLGIRRDLPYATETDDPVFVRPAVQIAASGCLNPGWIGHPGSTVIYPLAAVYHAWNASVHGGAWLRPDASVAASFSSFPGEFYLVGRLVAISYLILSLPLAYQVGRLAFGPVAALIGTWFFVLCPMVIEYAQQIRTDSASVFFTLLALWLCLRVYERLTAKRSLIAGMAVGLAVSTKYSLLVLAPFLFAVQLVAWWRQPRRQAEQLSRELLRSMLVGIFVVPLTFAATTPYFFLDYSTTRAGVAAEVPSTHLGADGLSPQENLRWYLLNAIPTTLGGARTVFVIIGVMLALWRGMSRQSLLLGFCGAYIIEVSLHPLHWSHWVIPILPILMFAAAAALGAAVVELCGRLKLPRGAYASLLFVGTMVLSYEPACDVIRYARQHANPSTRVQAREWVVQNLPPGSRIAQEWYTAALDGTDFNVLTRFSLAADQSVEGYARAGYRYVSVSDGIYRRYFAEANRYPAEVAFYQELFSGQRLLQQFKPSATRAGPTIRIYELQDATD